MIHPTSKSRFEVLWRTLIIDFYERSHPAPDALQDQYLEYIAWTLVTVMASDEELGSGLSSAIFSILQADNEDPSCTVLLIDPLISAVVAALTSNLDPNDTTKFSRLLIEQADAVMYRRYIFTEGNRLAIGPKSAEPGDEIWILGGSDVPVVLRKASPADGSRYSYVGHAYVHGIMFGEAVTENAGLQRIILV